MYQYFAWNVGKGEKISLWHDHWHPNGQLHLLFTDENLANTGFVVDAKLNCLIHNCQWELNERVFFHAFRKVISFRNRHTNSLLIVCHRKRIVRQVFLCEKE
ncbi:hypothetical protein Droror1_Dr00016510 [Drosera rotundifolia]